MFHVEHRPMTENSTDLRVVLRQLRVLNPPVWPVIVRRVVMDDYGDCAFVKESRKGPHFVIRVSKSLDGMATIFVLLHEWAHALSWGSDSHRIRNHGPEWGIAMSRIWQSLYED